MDAADIHARKRALAVCLAVLIVTSFAIVHTAAGTLHGDANFEIYQRGGVNEKKLERI